MNLSFNAYPKLPSLYLPFKQIQNTVFEGRKDSDITEIVPTITPSEYTVLYRYFSNEKLDFSHFDVKKILVETKVRTFYSDNISNDVKLVESFDKRDIRYLNCEVLCDESIEKLSKELDTIYIFGNENVPMLMFTSNLTLFWIGKSITKPTNSSVISYLANMANFPCEYALPYNACNNTNYQGYCQYLNLIYGGIERKSLNEYLDPKIEPLAKIQITEDYYETNLYSAFIEGDIREAILYRYFNELNNVSKHYSVVAGDGLKERINRKYFCEGLESSKVDSLTRLGLEAWFETYYRKRCYIKKFSLVRVFLKR